MDKILLPFESDRANFPYWAHGLLGDALPAETRIALNYMIIHKGHR